MELIAEIGFGGGAWLSASDLATEKTSNIRIERPTRSVECCSLLVGRLFLPGFALVLSTQGTFPNPSTF